MKQKYGLEKMQFYKDQYQHNLKDLSQSIPDGTTLTQQVSPDPRKE